jgi:DNA-3-methyladenine glycosylase II
VATDLWRQARRELGARHPQLRRLVDVVHPLEPLDVTRRSLDELAMSTVVSQLVSSAAAATIKRNLLAAHGGVDQVFDWALTTPDDAPPQFGLSRSKRKAIAAWAAHSRSQGDLRHRWAGLGADELLAEVTAIRGFGRWSAEMVAIFGFGHPDIWPEGDAGVQRVIRRLLPRMKPPGRRRLVAGHSTYAALCCWAVIDRGLEAEL